jgi:class III poly(R)-hydroxyalkanoic acid synthase PhaE subunit
MAKAFAETQDQFLKNMVHWIRGVSSPTALHWDVTRQGTEEAVEAFNDWTAETKQVVNDVAERLRISQKEMLRFMELSLQAWKAIAPKIESGEDWHAVLLSFTENLRQQLLQFPQEMLKTSEDSHELWRLYGEQWKELVQPWAATLRQAPWHFGQASPGNGSALIEFANIYWDAYEKTFGRLMESPSLGLTRELNQDLLTSFDAWLDYRRASFEYHVALSEAWIQAFTKFIEQRVDLAEKGETVPGVRKLLFLWVEVVDQVFTGVFRSEEYIRIQANLVNTSTAYKLRERELADAFLKTSHVASRSELDEAYRRIYELRKDVKELKKARQEIQAELAEAKAVREAFDDFKVSLKEIQAELPKHGKKKQ